MLSSIPHLREAIRTIDSRMATLMNERSELENQLERAARSQSPVFRIPSELLSTIFVIGVLEMDILIPTLQLVCRYWSDVAVNTPVLWAKISVSPLDSIDKIRRRLSRSKGCPLDINIHYVQRYDYSYSISEQIIHAMDLIRPALWRTRTFSLSVPSRSQAHAALLRCKEDAPLLESLSIQVHNVMLDDRTYSSSPLPLFNGVTPMLKLCSLSGFNFEWDVRPLSRLRVLKLGGYYNEYFPSFSTLLTIMKQCPDLEELALRNICPDGCGDDVHAPLSPSVPFPRLRRLSFYNAVSQIVPFLMSSISFPNLEYLDLCYLQNITSVLQYLHSQSLTRLPLRELRVEACYMNELRFLNLLRRLSSLTTLEMIEVEDVSPHFLQCLSSSQPWVCPKLEKLSIEGCTSIEWDHLRTFVECRLPLNVETSRQRPARTFRSASEAAAAHARARSLPPAKTNLGLHRLRSVDVTRCSQISGEMVEWLRMYVPEVKCESIKTPGHIWDAL
ncbi:hypothetical protein FISHEDRAFT_67143 [Fistulina hepatica ATCC 64428]|uniref:F-box domain-containing protein n=1 Tax=Fistulina hepatica ATCC 64428 TaxID=1128425 RepID=A0A0D7A388_9AGAR|nr:hypothetical protein FISHEDRAFT_67143 [Fistulina hepatica ATCC 64428]